MFSPDIRVEVEHVVAGPVVGEEHGYGVWEPDAHAMSGSVVG